jgi:hypothetical protein
LFVVLLTEAKAELKSASAPVSAAAAAAHGEAGVSKDMLEAWFVAAGSLFGLGKSKPDVKTLERL